MAQRRQHLFKHHEDTSAAAASGESLLGDDDGNDDGPSGVKANDKSQEDAGERLGDASAIVSVASCGVELLDLALEDIGAGRYQNCVLAVALFSVFVDVSELALTSLLYVEFERDWGASPRQLAAIGSSAASGLMLGSALLGWYSDRRGRLRAFHATLLCSAAASALSSFAGSVAQYAACRFAVSVAVGGNVVLCNSLLLECVPSSSRSTYLVLVGAAYGLAHLVAVLLAWALFPSVGWRWVIRALALLFVPVLVLLRFVRESPRFYVMTGQHAKAHSVVEHIAAVNGKRTPLFFSAAALAQASSSPGPCEAVGTGRPGPSPSAAATCSSFPFCLGLGLGLSRRHMTTLVPLCAVWFLQSFASGVFQFLPLQLRLSLGVRHVQFAVASVLSAGGLVATALNLVCARRFRRVPMVRCGALVSAMATASLALDGRRLGLLLCSAFVMQVGTCLTYSTLYLYSPEVFSTRVRGTAFGLCLVASRVAHVVSPFLAASFAEPVRVETKLSKGEQSEGKDIGESKGETSSLVAPSLLFAAFFVATALASLCLSVETFGKHLQEDHDGDDSNDSDAAVAPQDSDGDDAGIISTA